MRPDVPPDVRVVGDAARALELADDLRVVGVVLEAGRRAGAWERREHHLPARGEARRLAAPERGGRREGEQLRQVHEQAVHHLDRLLRVVDGHVHVHAEDQLAPGDVLQLVDELAVPVARGDALALEEGERVRAGRAEAAALGAGDLGDVAAQLRERAHTSSAVRQTGVVTSSTDCISSAWIRLGARRRATAARTESMCCTRSHVSGSSSMYSSSTPSVNGSLLPNAWSSTLAAPGRALGALAGDRRREDLLHGGSITASASISTSQRGSSSSRDDAGRRGPCGRERLAVGAADVVDGRRVGDVDARAHDVVERRPGLRSARSMISRQTRACS